jgi:hypothetical protein|tara:strand:+ start:7284 stop:7787 length:504 start_codon:yes stop_codon:yes gene_type:complete
MQILTLENEHFDLQTLPKEIDKDIRYSVLDNSDPKDPDYFFVPLIYLESFSSPAVVLQIGKHQVQMPLEWSMVVGNSEVGDLEVLPLTSLNDRGFEAFCFNPLTSRRPEFLPVDVINVYQDVKFYFPKLKNGQLLTTPIQKKKNPECVFFVKEVSRQSEVIDFSLVW